MIAARSLLFALAVAGVIAVWAFSCMSKRFEYVAAGVMPLEPRAFDALTVIAVGSGGTFENHQRLGPAVAVGLGETLLLVDAGRAVAEGLRQARIPVQQPSWVLLTSLLPENTVGLDDLLYTRALAVRPTPLGVAGPPGTRALVEGLLAAHAEGGRAHAAGLGAEPEVVVREVAESTTLVLPGLLAHAFALPGGPFPALAWRLETDDRIVLLSSAGFAPDALVAAGRGAQLWVHAALYGEALDAALAQGAERPDVLRVEAAWHTRLEDVGALAARMEVRGVALLRLRPPPVFDYQYRRIVERSFEGRVLLPEDGTELTL